MTVKCKNCGAKQKENAKVCTNCGASLEDTPSNENPNQQTQTS